MMGELIATARGRNHTKPSSLLKDSVASRTWAQCTMQQG